VIERTLLVSINNVEWNVDKKVVRVMCTFGELFKILRIELQRGGPAHWMGILEENIFNVGLRRKVVN
jgi:hypothetical protein